MLLLLCPPFSIFTELARVDFLRLDPPGGHGSRREVLHFLHKCLCQGQMEFSGGLPE